MSEGGETYLLERFLRGERSVGIELFRRYNALLFLYCAPMLGGESNGEEAVREIWDRLLQFGTPIPVNHADHIVLLQLAREVCATSIRGIGRPTSTSPIEQDLSNEELLILTAFRSLSPEDREMMVLTAYCQLTVADTAQVLDRTLQEIEGMLARIRSQLRTTGAAWIEASERKGNNPRQQHKRRRP